MPLWQARMNAYTNHNIGQGAAPAALTMPAKVQLTTTVGTATATGTVVTGASYADQSLTAAQITAAAGTAAASNNVTLTYASMPAVPAPGVQGVNVIDSTATTPLISGSGGLTAAKVVNAGDTFSIAAGALTESIQ